MKRVERRRLRSLLVAYDEALASGGSRVPEVAGDAPEIDDAVRETMACLELMERVRRQQVEAESDDADAPRDSSLGCIGRFRLIRELGRGGLGLVYLAYDPALGREVALKLPRSETLLSDATRARFLREAEAAARLSHPHLLALYEVVHAHHTCYLVSEFCPGPTLAQWLAMREDPVPPRLAAELIALLADAVHHAHVRKVLHRDIKPSNIMLDRTDGAGPDEPWIPKLTDFGMAKLLEATGDETRTGAVIGTPAYMAPEQIDGRSNQLDARTDVYGLGAVLYELLAGRPPFRGVSDVDTLRQLVIDEPSRPRQLNREVPRDLEAICLKCLARNPGQRYATAAALEGDLRRFLAGEPTLARPQGPLGRAWKWARRRPAVSALSAAVALSLAVLLAGGAFYNWRLRDEVRRASAAQEWAEREADQSRRLLYASDVRLAYEALQADHVAQALACLDRQTPTPGKLDLREFAWHQLKHQCHPATITLQGHSGAVFGVAFAPDGRSLASAGIDGTVRLWNADTGAPLHVLQGHTSEVTSVAFSPDGQCLASGSEDATIRLWDPQSGELRQVLTGHTDHVLALAFTPDSRLLATAGRDGTLRVWDLTTNEPQAILEAPDVVRAVAFTPDGSRLFAANELSELRSWSTHDWRALPHVWIDSEKFFALAVAPDGSRVAAAGRLELVSEWTLGDDGLSELSQFDGHKEWVQTLAYSCDGTLASGGKDGIIFLSSSEGRRKLLGHTMRIWSVAFSPDGRRLASCDDAGIVRVWVLDAPGAAGGLPVELPHRIVSGESADENLLLTGSRNSHFGGWDIEQQRKVFDTPLLYDAVAALRVSPDRTLVAVQPKAGPTQVWKIGDWTAPLFEVPRGDATASRLAWSPDSKTLATILGASSISLIDVDTRSVTRELPQGSVVKDFVLTADGTRLLVSTQVGFAAWRLANDTRDFQLQGSFDRIVVDRAGLTAWVLGTANVWRIDLVAGQVQSTLPVVGGAVWEVALSPDDRTLAVMMRRPQVVSLWDARTDQELLRLPYEDGQANALQFSRDGRRLIAIGEDPVTGKGRLWQWFAN